ncbi:unnamed protein product [Amoebophrya sp. A120]|nr:unnamed protein product [Amoebophrya sp. A120]|eukprot:GSA120T00003025001.1
MTHPSRRRWSAMRRCSNPRTRKCSCVCIRTRIRRLLERKRRSCFSSLRRFTKQPWRPATSRRGRNPVLRLSSRAGRQSFLRPSTVSASGRFCSGPIFSNFPALNSIEMRAQIVAGQALNRSQLFRLRDMYGQITVVQTPSADFIKAEVMKSGPVVSLSFQRPGGRDTEAVLVVGWTDDHWVIVPYGSQDAIAVGMNKYGIENVVTFVHADKLQNMAWWPRPYYEIPFHSKNIVPGGADWSCIRITFETAFHFEDFAAKMEQAANDVGTTGLLNGADKGAAIEVYYPNMRSTSWTYQLGNVTYQHGKWVAELITPELAAGSGSDDSENWGSDAENWGNSSESWGDSAQNWGNGAENWGNRAENKNSWGNSAENGWGFDAGGFY